MRKYDKYKSEFIYQFIAHKVKNFTDFAKQKKWIKKSVSENGTLGRLKPKWESDALARLGKIEQELEVRLLEDTEITKREALKTKRAIFYLIRKKIVKDDLSMGELKKCWEIARTEAGEPIRITNQQLSNDRKQPFTTIADLLNSMTARQPDSTIPEMP